jgi:hypothetical protein
MTEPHIYPTGATVVFRFCGGARDGEVFRSDRPKDANEVQSLWKLTWNGCSGRRFEISTSNSTLYQRYEVNGVSKMDDEIHVRCEYIGQSCQSRLLSTVHG